MANLLHGSISMMRAPAAAAEGARFEVGSLRLLTNEADGRAWTHGVHLVLRRQAIF
jgi:hypothetical protein